MGASSPGRPPDEDRPSLSTARTASEVVELLGVLWEQGRNSVPTKPVSPSQLRVLYVLQQEDGINLRGLGQLLNSAPPSVSRLCDRLEALGFVERRPSPVSRRELELHLTRRAVTYLGELRARREEALLAVLDRMPATERRRLENGLAGFVRAAATVAAADEPGAVRTSRSRPA